VDDFGILNDEVGDGVAQTVIAVDGPAYSVYAGTFSLAAEGLHAVKFYSVDIDSNAESTTTVSVAIDTTPPSTTLMAGEPSAIDALGGLNVSSRTLLSLVTVDPVSHGVASGLDTLFYV